MAGDDTRKAAEQQMVGAAAKGPFALQRGSLDPEERPRSCKQRLSRRDTSGVRDIISGGGRRQPATSSSAPSTAHHGAAPDPR